eukprot:m.61425 g.61425  ORF g.61425 m.61425 type:complete len:302 (-) comp7991_c3_seq3:3061-3966(-)
MTTKTFEFIVNHSWEHTLFAYDRKSWKVPSPEFPEIIDCDFKDWHLDNDTNTVSFKRIAQLKPPLPSWLMRLLSGVNVTELEFETRIDRQNQTAIVKGKNNTLRNILEMTEHLEIKTHPEDAERTIVTFTATWKIKLKLFSSKLENYLMTNYSKALAKGREIDHEFLLQFKEAGHILPPLSFSEKNCFIVFNEQHDSILMEEYNIYKEDVDQDGNRHIIQNDIIHSKQGSLDSALGDEDNDNEDKEDDHNNSNDQSVLDGLNNNDDGQCIDGPKHEQAVSKYASSIGLSLNTTSSTPEDSQ